MTRSFAARLLLAGLLAFAATAEATAQHLGRNLDFARPGTPPPGWHLDAEAARKGSVAIVAAEDGRNQLVLEPNARNTPSAKPLGIGQILPPEAVQGRRVSARARLAGKDGAVAVLGLAVLLRGGPGEIALARSEGADGRLREASVEVTVPTSPAVQGVILMLTAEGTAGRALFRDVAVEVASVVPPAAQPRSAATSTRQAEVRIDAGRELRRIPRTLFGTNIEWIRDANGLWDRRANQPDPTLVAMTRELGLSLIRYPGGVWSDTHDWRDGIGPPARRPLRPLHPGSRERWAALFGTDEALAFAETVGARLLLTVNAAANDPDLAAAWVRYVNRPDQRTHPSRRVDIWQIGNELYMRNDLSGGSIGPEAYAERYLAYARAMRAADPTIRLAAIGLRNYGNYRFNAHERWNEIVLSRAGHEIDILSVHNAYAPLIGDGRGADPAEVYRAMLAAPVLIAQNLRDTHAEIRRFAPRHADRIELAVTEWGPLFAVDPASPWIDHVKTLGSAVFVAATLKVFLEHAPTTIATFFKLNEPSFMGWIGRRDGSWVPNAPYEAFRMVSRGFGDRLVAAEVSVGSFASRATGFISAVPSVPYLDAIAALDGATGSLTVLLVNKDLDAAIDVDLRWSRFSAAGVAEVELLTGPSPDAHRGAELPRVPGLTWARQAGFAQGAMSSGGADAVTVLRDRVTVAPERGRLRIPPHSVALLTLRRN